MNAKTPPSATIRLHGYPVSNYFNTARAAMIELGGSGDFITAKASRDDDFLAMSPMGKIPFLETRLGVIAETVAILDYLDASAPHDRSLSDGDPFGHARIVQVTNIVQLYIETPLRTLYPAVFMGGTTDGATIATARASLDRALGALSRLCIFDPFLVGKNLSQADLMAFFAFDLGERVASHCWDGSILDTLPQLRAWDTMMRDRASCKIVLADFQSSFQDYLAMKNAAWREPFGAANMGSVHDAA